ncbi:MAG TPA: cytochrome b [Mariprofundaceae bacterium]|nr:cytochrome b [Mariprofundaceae bacterium]
MKATNTHASYGWVSIGLHWLMALTIFGMFALGIWMRSLDYYDSWYHEAPYIHKSIGILLLLLLVFRLGWRLFNARPDLMGLWWEKIIALAVHRLHYLLMFTVMLSGYLIPTAEGVGIDVFGLFTVPATFTFDKQQADLIGKIHWASAWAMMGLAAMHTGAALKHHVIDKDMTLMRMLGFPQKNKGENT